MFATLWKALTLTPSKIHLTPVIKSTLQDWRTLLQHLAKHPTPVQLLVPHLPNYIQYTDACHLGCGGVIGPGTLPLPHLVWQYKWPNDIRQRLHHKKLSINDLELAGLVLGWLILELSVEDLHFKHVGSFCDNTSSVSWCHKGYSSKSIPAARLLRFLSLRQRARKTSSIIPVHIPGKNNTMADICSRAFRSGAYFAAESNLLAYFNSHFPLPQNMSWIERTIPAKLTWRVISCLHGKTLPMASLTRLPKIGKNIGVTGVPTVQPAKPIPSSMGKAPSTEPSSSQAMLQGCGQELTATELKSKFKQSIKPWQPSPRPANWLLNVVPPSKVRENTLLPSAYNLKASDDQTHPPSLN